MQPTSEELRGVLTQAMSGTAEAFESLSGFVLQAGDHLRSGQIREGNELLGRITEDLHVLSGFLADAGQLPEFTDRLGDQRVKDLAREYEDMVELLRGAMDAQRTEDWVYLADILEYELNPKMTAWQSLFQDFSERLQG